MRATAALLLFTVAACGSPAASEDTEPTRLFEADNFTIELPLAAEADERPGLQFTIWYFHVGGELLGGIYVGCSANFPTPVPIEGAEPIFTKDDLVLRVSHRKDGLLVMRQWLMQRPRLAQTFKDNIPQPPPWPCELHVWTAGSAAGISPRALRTMSSVVPKWDAPVRRTTR
jgi:hypothetical protein